MNLITCKQICYGGKIMDIKRKLNEIQDLLSDEQEEERKIVNDLMFLMFGRDSAELP